MLIAHRLGAAWGPENTLQAFDAARRAGLRAFECDVKLSADGVPFLLHDDDLARTTGEHGRASARRWSSLAPRVPTLQALAAAAAPHALTVNLEIKPDADADSARQADWGRRIAAAAARLWARSPQPPLLSSFSLPALQAAAIAAPQLPRAWLCTELPPHWREAAQALRLEGIHLCASRDQAAAIAALRAQGLRARLYTVDDPAAAARWRDAGADALFTDALVPEPT
ncbi:glycerophosphoryl diester phosphodiesterase [mine drainage metagenome]|uniref:Glycerophosphoryl diester phosphodiesterase n=1 Tax=mine drainage metagenome TaxID=410659 RepID=A0A1J5QRM0_9ZZZZ